MTSAVPAPGMMSHIGVLEAVYVTAQHEGVSMRSETEFAALYQARFGDLASQLYAYLGDRAEAQDVTQEAFVRAWQRWTKISTYDDPVAWVRRVAWNLATSRHRRLAVARRFLSRSRPPEPQPGAGPDRVALVAALRRLPEKQRRALVLHHLADLSVAEIARDIGVAEGTVKSWLHRGRAELAKQLSETDEASGARRERSAPAGRNVAATPSRRSADAPALGSGSSDATPLRQRGETVPLHHAKTPEEVNEDE